MCREECDLFVRCWQWRGAPGRNVKGARCRRVPRKRLTRKCGYAFLAIRLLEQHTDAAGIRLEGPGHRLHVVERHGWGRGLLPSATDFRLRKRLGTVAKGRR